MMHRSSREVALQKRAYPKGLKPQYKGAKRPEAKALGYLEASAGAKLEASAGAKTNSPFDFAQGQDNGIKRATTRLENCGSEESMAETKFVGTPKKATTHVNQNE